MKETKTLKDGLKSLLKAQAKLLEVAKALGTDEFTLYRMNRKHEETKATIRGINWPKKK